MKTSKGKEISELEDELAKATFGSKGKNSSKN